MKFIETPLKGAYVIEIDSISDNRGFFARSWCEQEFSDHGLNSNLVQCNISFNTKKGTLRGMHYQIKPHEEAKLVRCTQGSIYDVIIDIRPNSLTFKSWFSIELSATNGVLKFNEIFGKLQIPYIVTKEVTQESIKQVLSRL